MNSCCQAAGQIPQHSSSYGVYGNVTSQWGPSRGTNSSEMDRANRRAQGFENLRNNSETIPYTAGSGRGSHISCRKSSRHSQGIAFLSLLGLTLWCPRFSTFPRVTQSQQHLQPTPPWILQSDPSPLTLIPADPCPRATCTQCQPGHISFQHRPAFGTLPAAREPASRWRGG